MLIHAAALSLTILTVVIFGGAFLGFTLARLQYLNFYGIFCNGQAGAAPGECYWYTSFLVYKVGIILHLSAILRGFIPSPFELRRLDHVRD